MEEKLFKRRVELHLDYKNLCCCLQSALRDDYKRLEKKILEALNKLAGREILIILQDNTPVGFESTGAATFDYANFIWLNPGTPTNVPNADASVVPWDLRTDDVLDGNIMNELSHIIFGAGDSYDDSIRDSEAWERLIKSNARYWVVWTTLKAERNKQCKC